MPSAGHLARKINRKSSRKSIENQSLERPWSTQNRRKIALTMLQESAARRKLDFSAPGRDLASILVASERSQALQGGLSGVPGRPWRLSGHSRGALGTLRDAPETLPRHLRDALGRHGVSGEGPRSDFESILDGVSEQETETDIHDRHTLLSKKARRRESD